MESSSLFSVSVVPDTQPLSETYWSPCSGDTGGGWQSHGVPPLESVRDTPSLWGSASPEWPSPPGAQRAECSAVAKRPSGIRRPCASPVALLQLRERKTREKEGAKGDGGERWRLGREVHRAARGGSLTGLLFARCVAGVHLVTAE